MEKIPRPSLKEIELEKEIFELEEAIKADKKLSAEFGVQQQHGDDRLSRLAWLRTELKRLQQELPD